MSGAGICGAFPSSENASTVTEDPFAAPGNHRARSTTRRTVTVSRRRVPALTRLSLGLTTGNSLELAVARAVAAEAIGMTTASAPTSCRNDMAATVRVRDGMYCGVSVESAGENMPAASADRESRTSNMESAAFTRRTTGRSGCQLPMGADSAMQAARRLRAGA